VDGVMWSAAPACSALFSSFVGVRREREGQCFVRSPSTIEYRYSPSPSPSSTVFLPFFFLKNLCRIVFCYSYALRHHICAPLFLFLLSFLRFASPLDSLIAPSKETPPARSPVSISYRTVLYYNTYFLLRPTDRLKSTFSSGRYSETRSLQCTRNRPYFVGRS